MEAVLKKLINLTEEQVSCYCKFGGLFGILFLCIFIPVHGYLQYKKELLMQQQMHEQYVAQTTNVINDLSGQVSDLTQKYQKTEAFKKEATCLAKNIYYEIGTESKEGMLAIAQVTMNRKREGFANTICGVVYQRTETVCQFSWVCQNKQPPSPNVYSKAYEVARKSLTNRIAMSKLYNALYYHADYINPGWNKDLNFVTQIGPHRFYSEK
jgi:spore germination cell wall hydrolase CwlJ-like protein